MDTLDKETTPPAKSLLLSCSLSRVPLFETPWTAARQASLSFIISQSLLKLMSIESMMDIQSAHPLSSPSPAQPFPASGSFPVSWIFTSGGQSIGASAFSSSNEYSGLISFRIDWFDFLAVQGTLKSILQYHSSKASILQCSAFFAV